YPSQGCVGQRTDGGAARGGGGGGVGRLGGREGGAGAWVYGGRAHGYTGAGVWCIRRRPGTLAGTGPSTGGVRSAEVRFEPLSQVQLLQGDGLAAVVHRTVVDLVVAEARVQLRLGLLGGLHLEVPVPGQTRSGRDELTEDDVLLQAHQGIAAAAHRSLGQHLGGLLEGGGRQPRVGGQRR